MFVLRLSQISLTFVFLMFRNVTARIDPVRMQAPEFRHVEHLRQDSKHSIGLGWHRTVTVVLVRDIFS